MTVSSDDTNLPDDVLRLIADELLEHRDFSTLYNLAVASKRLAFCSLPYLYRIYNESSDDEEEAEGFQVPAEQELFVQKWAIKWRSIILSCMDETLFPYYMWLKALDLRDLAYLMGDQKFRNKIETRFFEGSLKTLRKKKRFQPTNSRFPSRLLLDTDAVIEAAGDVLVPKVPAIEQLSGPLQREALLRWVPHLRKLQRLELWIGRSLNGNDVQEAIYAHCPQFHALSIFSWEDPNERDSSSASEADVELGQFLSGLQSDSLTFFEIIQQCGIAEMTCQALAQHSRSLRELKLCLEKDSIPNLLLLHSCNQLQKLKIEISGGAMDEKMAEEPVLIELTSWLNDCPNLRSVELHNVGFAPKLLTPVFQSKTVQLEDLDIKALSTWNTSSWYSMKDHRDFHLSLGNQKKLRNLSLVGDATDVTRDDNDALVQSVCQCKELRRLKLRGVSEYLSEEAVISLLAILHQLEELYIHGLTLTNDVLDSVVTHPYLKSICFMDLTFFTFQGLLSFVERLDDSKHGFELSVNMASTDHLLSDQEVHMIQQLLYDKVGGKFDYVAHRDPDALSSDYSLESD